MTTRIVACTVLALLIAGAACADAPPPMGRDPISLDRDSPSVTNFGERPAHIYGDIGAAGGWDVGGPGPILHIPDVNYGVAATDDNDGHSLGNNDPNWLPIVYFSGDRWSKGLPGTQYRHQYDRNQAAGDRFVSNGWMDRSPADSYATDIPANLVVAGLGLGPNLLSANQTRYNEIPSIDRFAFNPETDPAKIDEMDALELHEMDVDGDQIHDFDLFFSLDQASPSLLGRSTADIFLSPAGVPNFGVWATAGLMGLIPTDDIDALVAFHVSGQAEAVAWMDYALFSLRPGNSLGVHPSDVMVTCFGGVSRLYIAGSTLGLEDTDLDELDALDIEQFGSGVQAPDAIPEPSALFVLGSGFVGLMGVVSRRRRA